MGNALLKATLPHMVVWMAKTAVQEGVRSYHRVQKLYDTEKQKEQSGLPTSYALANGHRSGINAAAEILWKLFKSTGAECQQAIEKVAQKRDGFGATEECLDDFMTELERVQGHSIIIRTTE